MTPNPTYQAVREKVIASVGKSHLKIPCTHKLMADENGCPFGEHLRPIGLCDVLLAINKPVKYHTRIPTIHMAVCKLLSLWNLRKDSLADQSPECWEFLKQILV